MDNLKPIGTVVIVDDSEIDRYAYNRILMRSSLVEQVIECDSGDAALALLRGPDRGEIDVIFLDINMPRMNGFDFLDAATSEFGETFAKSVVVMLTTSLSPRDRERAEKYSVIKRYINKPLTDELVAEIAELLQ